VFKFSLKSGQELLKMKKKPREALPFLLKAMDNPENLDACGSMIWRSNSCRTLSSKVSDWFDASRASLLSFHEAADICRTRRAPTALS
jgi:hypothetical protein